MQLRIIEQSANGDWTSQVDYPNKVKLGEPTEENFLTLESICAAMSFLNPNELYTIVGVRDVDVDIEWVYVSCIPMTEGRYIWAEGERSLRSGFNDQAFFQKSID